MKCRSLLLVACMLFVPLLAMFSHKIPADVRASMRRGLRDALGHCLGRPAEAGAPAPAAAVAADGIARTDFVVDAQEARSGADPVASGTTAAQQPSGDAVASPALVAQLADRSRQARDQQSIEARLKDLGAMAFDCQPLPGTGGLFSSSCRVPVDASGQLQRVFQATGADPLAATESLAQQVAAWRQRVVDHAPGTDPAATTARQSSPTRFR
jgi:hypothetical protein